MSDKNSDKKTKSVFRYIVVLGFMAVAVSVIMLTFFKTNNIEETDADKQQETTGEQEINIEETKEEIPENAINLNNHGIVLGATKVKDIKAGTINYNGKDILSEGEIAEFNVGDDDTGYITIKAKSNGGSIGDAVVVSLSVKAGYKGKLIIPGGISLISMNSAVQRVYGKPEAEYPAGDFFECWYKKDKVVLVVDYYKPGDIKELTITLEENQ